jgi:CheY-like chemotaxis protein
MFVIRVSDTGPGIPENLRDKIFDIFFTTKPVGKGTGLGLSISQNIIKIHGGNISFECPPEGGTTFIVELPLKHVGGFGRRIGFYWRGTCFHRIGRTMNDTTTILVADDERAIREGCHRVLTASGYKVLARKTVRIALEILSQNPVDILLLDLKMPVMGGEEVLEIVRKQYAHIPVIIITGHGTVDTAVACMKKGAYDFITKPFQIEPFLLISRKGCGKDGAWRKKLGSSRRRAPRTFMISALRRAG